MTDSGVSKRAVRGAAFLLSRRFLSSALRIGVLAVLARTLGPRDFGLAALANVLLQFVVFAGTVGFGTFVIYDRKDGWLERADTAFWLSLLCTLSLAGVALVLSPIVASFYNEPRLPEILIAFAVYFVFEQARAVPDALLQRELRFGTVAIRDLVREVAIGAIAIVLALNGWGVWSLVLPRLLTAPPTFVATLIILRWRPRGWIRRQHVRPVLRYALPLVGANGLLLAANEIDTLLVGHFLGLESLGVYTVAYQLANLVGRNVGAVFADVGMSTLAKVAEKEGELPHAYERVLTLISSITLPLLLGLFVLADLAVALAYGSQWGSAVPLLRIFLAFTIVRAVTAMSAVIFNVRGRPGLSFRINVAFVPTLALAIVAGATFGLVGVAVSVAVARILFGGIAFVLSCSEAGLPTTRGLRAIAPAFMVAGLMAIAVAACLRAMQLAGFPDTVRASLAIGVGGAFYAAGLARLAPKSFEVALSAVARLSPSVARATSRLAAKNRPIKA